MKRPKIAHRAGPLLMYLVSMVSSVGTLASARAQMGEPVDDSPIRSFVLIDQLEHAAARYTPRKGADALRFNALGWIGGDYDRLWFNTEGTKPYGGKLEDFDVQVLWGRLVAPFWDIQAGLRYFQPGSSQRSRNAAVFGVQGLAPYRYEVQAALFVSERGEVSARAELEYDIWFTQRWVLQPRLATNVALQKIEDQAIGRGVNNVELGMRLRYEIKRELAPYVGVSWQSRYGATAQFARDRGESVGGWAIVVGARLWF